MELLIALMKQAAKDGNLKVNIDFNEKIEKIVNDICFRTLLNVREILDNEELSDFECVEQIVCALEAAGFNGGSRHDFC